MSEVAIRSTPSGPGTHARRRCRATSWTDRQPGQRRHGARAAADALTRQNQTAPPLTVEQWLERWLVSRAAPRTSTLRGYAAHVRLYLAPYLAAIATELARGRAGPMVSTFALTSKSIMAAC